MIELGLGSFDNRFPYLNNCDIRCGVWVRNAEGHLVLNNNAVLDEMIKRHFFDDDDNNTLWEDEDHFDDEYSKIDNTSLNMFWHELTNDMIDYLTDISGEFVKQTDITDKYGASYEITRESYEQFIREYRIKMRVPHDFAPY